MLLKPFDVNKMTHSMKILLRIINFDFAGVSNEDGELAAKT